VPVFIPHAGCPHRCAFCNQQATTGQSESIPTKSQIRQSVTDFLDHRRDPARWTEISFYGGNFLGLQPEQIQMLLATVAPFVRQGTVNGLRFSTRPDTIDTDRLALVAPYPVTSIEIGVQSMNNEVLQQAQRGHDRLDTQRAMSLLRTKPYAVGIQLMIGLPGDTHATALATARQVANLAPDFVRIYPTLVLRNSLLARWYAQGRYEPLNLDEAVQLTAELYQIFSRNEIPVIRMGLQAAEELSPQAELVAGPHHPAFGELVHSALWMDAIQRHLAREGLIEGEILLDVNPRVLSQIKGQKDDNIMALIDSCQLRALEVRTNSNIDDQMVMINGKPCQKDVAIEA
jgi:histone acetyltransferase (RNA polymerase elongator complex component)